MQSLLTESWDGYIWVNSSRFVFEYGLLEFWTGASCERWVDSAWVPYNGTFSFVDSAGDNIGLYGTNVSVIYRMLVTSVPRDNGEQPTTFALYPNYPNPFNSSTTLKFDIPNSSFVSLKVFNTLGQEISTLLSEELNAGTYTLNWMATGLASGVYFYQMKGIDNQGKIFSVVRRMLLTK